jgi:betaine-aldehyde dehydrogenase
VQRKVKDAFVERLVARTRRMSVGDPKDPRTQVGALISADHMGKVLGAVERGRAEGAEVLAGGRRATEGALADGFFVQPTVFDRCRDEMSVVREENLRAGPHP